MQGNIIRLNETQFHSVIQESVQKILKEIYTNKTLITEGATDKYLKRVIANNCDEMYKPYLQTRVAELPQDFQKQCQRVSRRSYEICIQNNETFLRYLRYDLLTYFDIVRKTGPIEYLKGIARIACEELGMFRQDREEGSLAKFKQNVLFLYKSPELVNTTFDEDLNGLDYYNFIKIVDKARKEFNLKNRMNRPQVSNSNYKIVQINSFKEAHKYHRYTEWCVADTQGNYDNYTRGGNRFYFCLQEGFENVPRQRTEGCPLDAYGLSMIAVLIDLDGDVVRITTRWNHENDGEDNANFKTVEQFEDITHISWSNFIPYSEEERKRLGYYTLEDFDLSEGEYIDMGFRSGTKWCSHNYGAKTPREYGGYYTFDEAQELGITLPSKEQFEELTANTKSHWVSKGRIYISKLNGNSIFIPAAGDADNGSVDVRGSYGLIWSSSRYNVGSGWKLYFDSSGQYVGNYGYRCYGRSVRGVLD